MNLQAGVYVKPLIRQEKSYPIANRNLLSSSTASRSPASACGWHRMGKAKERTDKPKFKALCNRLCFLFLFFCMEDAEAGRVFGGVGIGGADDGEALTAVEGTVANGFY